MYCNYLGENRFEKMYNVLVCVVGYLVLKELFFNYGKIEYIISFNRLIIIIYLIL